MTHTSRNLLSIVYSSSAAHPYDDADLGALLALSRDNNARHDLTGMLLYRNGRFLQVLEGPEDALRRRMSIIAADPEHTDVRVLLQETIDERQFPDWTMGYEPMSESLADDVPGYRSTFSDLEGEQDPTRSLEALKELIRWFQDRAIQLR
ncbi:BLUF domain-containing protein [Arthrobacter agilis]|uniref:BLUF domain-containing protein n=1 Tax=Arthrobacter agilis TaxID=37921 RepID=UPI00236547D6|nr:BLUF domain-containing protein [Arthrobacter agilis]WDF32572.1 BLUF domain-containing protein [Arthrobacter agilis]